MIDRFEGLRQQYSNQINSLLNFDALSQSIGPSDNISLKAKTAASPEPKDQVTLSSQAAAPKTACAKTEAPAAPAKVAAETPENDDPDLDSLFASAYQDIKNNPDQAAVRFHQLADDLGINLA